MRTKWPAPAKKVRLWMKCRNAYMNLTIWKVCCLLAATAAAGLNQTHTSKNKNWHVSNRKASAMSTRVSQQTTWYNSCQSIESGHQSSKRVQSADVAAGLDATGIGASAVPGSTNNGYNSPSYDEGLNERLEWVDWLDWLALVNRLEYAFTSTTYEPGSLSYDSPAT